MQNKSKNKTQINKSEKREGVICTKCLLPSTFPFIKFDSSGVCNYCSSYKKHNVKPLIDLKEMVEKYRGKSKYDCIVPLSGGRDSYFTLIFVVNVLKLKPITYTYDWGMVTDIAQRNIKTISDLLNVPNITITANIKKKRKNIKKNLNAWLHKPDLGMLNILTAGDKHFFKYINTIKRRYKVKLNIWGVNHLETTHFKSAFLGLEPNLSNEKVYLTGFRKQIKYHWLRFLRMIKNPRYFNFSLFDTLSGEFYRSIKKKKDYVHLFDYYQWDENEIEETILKYGFEKSKESNSTWRIGDGTAALYDFLYYSLAGFSEHDTFRSNQIREGQITREQGLVFSNRENKIKENALRWYFEKLGLSYEVTMDKLNAFISKKNKK